MVDEIKGPINLQRSLPTKELRKAQDNSGDSDLNVDYKLSLNKELVATLTYSRTGRVAPDSPDGAPDFRQLVAGLLERQGITWEAAMAGEAVEIDDETRAKARALIADDGYWGVEQTSDRIFQFAIANAGNDPARLEQIKAAVDKGFEMAKEALGGILPEISLKTHDAVMEKLNNWVTKGPEIA